tara:strand:- start:2670 stop:2852 length:183 start_codon:yes stop_codon:yes gene_type:complete
MSHRLIKLGTKVKYYPILSNKSVVSEHEIVSECWAVCGETVVKISGKSGGVSINHLEAIS